MPPGAERDAYVAAACGDRADLRESVESLLSAQARAGAELFLTTRDATAGLGSRNSERAQDAAGMAAMFLKELAGGTLPKVSRMPEGGPGGGDGQREAWERIEAGLKVRALKGREAGNEGEAEDGLPRFPGFRLENRLGGGGLGVVYAAFDEKLERRVAIKVLRSRTDAGVRRRVLDEARKAAALDDPAVVTIFSVLDEADTPAIVMEHVEGYAIDRFSDQLSFEQKARLLRDVARGLAAAHARGVIHRDLKPDNVIVGPEMRPKILDFGLALSLEEASASGRGFEGTPLYASPEQVRGQSLTAASDVFSLGSLMFKVFTGRAPFAGRTVGDVLEAIATTVPPFLRDVAVGVPEDLQAIVLACLAWDPADRPTAGEVGVELGRYLAGEPVHLRPRLYEDLLRQRVSEHAQDVANWEAQGIVSRDERDQLQTMHRRLLADEDHWIIDARRLTSAQTTLYTSTWIVVVAAVLWVWRAREDVAAPWGWLAPAVATGVLLGTGWVAHRRRENLASASFLAAGGLSLVPAILSVLRELGWWASPAPGIGQLLGPTYTNAQCFVACLGALVLSAVTLGRLRMTGFAWTTLVLGVAAYGAAWMMAGWLDWPAWRQALACLPLVTLEGVALGFERVGRVRWSFPYHLAALAALVGALDVMAYDGPTLERIGVPSGAYFNEDRLQSFSFAANGLVFLLLMFATERSKSLDLRRSARVLEVVALMHAEGSLFANAMRHRGEAGASWDVGLYLGVALLFLVLGAWRARWRLLVGALAGLAFGSYLLVDLGLVERVPFILALGTGGLAVAGLAFAYLVKAPRSRGWSRKSADGSSEPPDRL